MSEWCSGNMFDFESKVESSILSSDTNIPEWCNGNTADSDSANLGSIPSSGAKS